MKKDKTDKKGSKTDNTEIHDEIDSFLYERNKKQIDTFIKERNTEKKIGKLYKITRLHLILIISILYFFILILGTYLVALPSDNIMPFVLFSIIGYIGILI